MGDEHLRRVERRSAIHADAETESSLLRARLRAGQVSSRALALAAYAGSLAAARALGADAPARPAALVPWAEGLAAWGLEACVRAGVAAARRARVADASPACAAALSAADAWCQEPSLTRDEAACAAALDASEQDGSEDFGWTFLEIGHSQSLRAEFQREVAAPNQTPIRDLLPFAGAYRTDDVAGLVLVDGRASGDLIQVHLTWTHEPEAEGFPWYSLLDLPTWVAEECAGSERPRARASALAAAAPFCPPTLREHPGFNAALALVAAARLVGEDAARAAASDALLAWALAQTPT